MASDTHISPEQYEERRLFVELMKTMGKSEFVEIARILRKHNVPISENRSGVYFDMAKVPEAVFRELLQFRMFVKKTNVELEKRDAELKEIPALST